MRTFLAAFAAMALTSGAAQAYCPSVPDDAGSRYVENGLARSVCLQDELDYETRRRAVDSQVDAALGKVRRDMLQQKFQIQQMRSFGQPRFNGPFLP